MRPGPGTRTSDILRLLLARRGRWEGMEGGTWPLSTQCFRADPRQSLFPGTPHFLAEAAMEAGVDLEEVRVRAAGQSLPAAVSSM